MAGFESRTLGLESRVVFSPGWRPATGFASQSEVAGFIVLAEKEVRSRGRKGLEGSIATWPTREWGGRERVTAREGE